MTLAFLEHARGVDQLVVAIAIAGLVAVVHGAAYNAAEGALRVQRQLLRRGADAVGVAGVVAIVQMLVG